MIEDLDKKWNPIQLEMAVGISNRAFIIEDLASFISLLKTKIKIFLQTFFFRMYSMDSNTYQRMGIVRLNSMNVSVQTMASKSAEFDLKINI